jgi:hypothetical protein
MLRAASSACWIAMCTISCGPQQSPAADIAGPRWLLPVGDDSFPSVATPAAARPSPAVFGVRPNPWKISSASTVTVLPPCSKRIRFPPAVASVATMWVPG